MSVVIASGISLFAESGSLHIDRLSRRGRPFEGTRNSRFVRGDRHQQAWRVEVPAEWDEKICFAVRRVRHDRAPRWARYSRTASNPASDGVSVRRIADLTRYRLWRRANGRWNTYP